MTLSDFIASGKAGSRATVYRRLHEAGIDVDGLRGADGQLTVDGLAILGNIFDNVKREDKDQAQVETGSSSGTASGTAADTITISKEEYTDLIRRAAEFETLAAERQLRIDDLKQQVINLQETQQRLLPAVAGSPATDQPRHGLFGWLRRKAVATK